MPPVFYDEEKTRIGNLLYVVLLTSLGAVTLVFVAALVIRPFSTVRFFGALGLFSILAAAFAFMKRGAIRLASKIAIGVLVFLVVGAGFLLNGLETPGFTSLMLVIIMAGLLLGVRAARALAIFGILVATLIFVGQTNGVLPLFPTERMLVTTWLTNAILFAMAAVLLQLSLGSIYKTLDRARRSESALQRVNRAYRVLSDCNQTLIRAKDEATLLRDVCRVIVERGGYSLAWVGFLQGDGSQSLRPMTAAGDAGSYLDSITSVGRDCDPTLTAVERAEMQVLNVIDQTQCSVPEKITWSSIFASPLIVDNSVIGTLSVYAREVFGTEEIALLKELADDLAFGISVLRIRSEHEEVTEDLAERHRLLRTLIDNIPHIIFMKDTEGRYTLVNKLYAEYANHEQEAIIGKTALDLFPSAEAQYLHAFDMENMRQGNVLVDREVETVRHDTGEKRWLLMNQLPLLNAQNEPIGLLGIGHDITDRIRMEQELRYHASLIENTSDAIVSTSTDLVVLSWNKAAEAMYEIPAMKAIGRRISELTQTEYHGQTREEVVKQIFEQGEWWGEITQTTHTGKTMYVQVAATVLRDSDGKITSVISVNRDITSQKQMREAVLNQQQLEMELQQQKDLLATRNRFMSMVSHEFRTPLSVIQSSTELIDYYWDRMTSDKRQMHVRRMRAQVSRLDGLIEDFALAIRAENGHLTFQPATMNIELFCREIFEEFEMSLNEHHQLIFESSDQIDEIHGDRLLLGYILRNLLSNAIKYSPEGGEIALRLTSDRRDITLVIQDEGIGIPPEDQVRLFEPYHRASNVGTIRGTGLGLKIVKDCVELHGGRIEVTSELNQGTTFTLTLPIL